jgi:hypothetical protein
LIHEAEQPAFEGLSARHRGRRPTGSLWKIFPLLAAAALYFTASSRAATVQPDGPGAQGWAMTYYASAAKLALWSTAKHGGQGNDCYRPKTVTLGKFLDISIRPVPDGCPTGDDDGTAYAEAGNIVSSFRQAYGVFQAKIYLPGDDGQIANWPAFWMDGTRGEWPEHGEIDVMEGLGGRDCTTYHYGSDKHVSRCYGSATGWHTWTVAWLPNMIRTYLDGTAVATLRIHTVSDPMEVIFDNQMAGPLQQTGATMQVAYFAAWQRS